ncbi:hypothetical protein ACER0C_009577 [Sarotherodon galilaeus]
MGVPTGVSGGAGPREGSLAPPFLPSPSPAASLFLLHHNHPHMQGLGVGYQTPPLWGHLRPSKVWRPISPHHFPCQWQTPSDIGALVVLCVWGWASRYTPAHSLAATYRGLEPGARSGHFGGGVPSASRPGARSLWHSWLLAELTGTSLQPPWLLLRGC